MRAIVWLIVIITSIWVLIDAKKIGVKKGQIKGLADIGPWGWFFVCLLLWIIGFPLYLLKRGELKRINGKA
jgi:choline-glycine betaine transporter